MTTTSSLRVAVWLVCALAVACSEPQRSTFTPDAAPDALADVTADLGGACRNDNACDDRIACTIDHCRAGVCTHEPCTDCCAAGLECQESIGCARARQPCARDADCGDGIRCTLDRCHDGMYCEHAPQDALCEGGTICLAALGCIPPPPDHCNADADCAMSFCRGTWRCLPELGCQFRGPTNCDDDVACTTDTCSDAMNQCVHAARDVDGDRHGDTTCGGDDCDDANPARHPGATEVCADRVDNDCDGMVDEGCCTAGAACATSCGSMGATTCNADGTAGPCRAPTESCNGRDDDCDGAVDNGFDCAVGASGACTTSCGSTGRRTCLGSCTWDACAPPMETCNGRDDDCDGLTDESCCTAGMSCMTSCSSTGTTTCNADGTPGPCRPPAETCNGRDDDCDGAVDQTYACAQGATSACTTTCGGASTRTCNADCTAGPCRAPAETCNGRDDDCDGVVDNGFACAAGATGACTTACGSTGRRTCLGSCMWDACAPPAEVCNGADDNCNGACDDGFTCCARATRDCSALGFVSGTATCRGDCGGFDTSGCSNCGNARRDTGEACDGADLAGQTCATQGFGGGTLRCTTRCAFDTAGCSSCGNNRRDTGEVCDGTDLGGQTCAGLGMGFTGGALRCNAACGAFDTTMCTRPFNPTGTWVVSPGVNHYCAFGTVSLSFGTLTFTDTGAGLSVSGGGVNCTMTGPSARASRMINVTCTLPGGCNETYTLTGMFTTDNAFTGTFTAGFTGSGCFDCRTRMYTAAGSR